MQQATKSALIIVDVQNDFCTGGSLAVNGSLDIIPVINKLRDLPFDAIVLTRDFHPQNHVSFASNHKDQKPFTTITLENGQKQELWPDHCVQGSNGVEFQKDLIVQKEKDLLFVKGSKCGIESYSGFGSNGDDTGLLAKLKEMQIKKCFVVGLAYDFCVGSTAIDSANHGFETYVVMDATRSVSEPTEKVMEERVQKTTIKKQKLKIFHLQ